MKSKKIVYWVATGLVSCLATISAVMYLVNYEEVSQTILNLQFPTFIIYPLAIAKLLGVTSILLRKNKSLTEWAYAGFFFNFLLAAGAHISINDGEFVPAIVALILLIISYTLAKTVRK